MRPRWGLVAVAVAIAIFYWVAGQDGLSFWEFSLPAWVVMGLLVLAALGVQLFGPAA